MENKHCNHDKWAGIPEVDAYCVECGKGEMEVALGYEVYHKYLGVCRITHACEYMQKSNPDVTSIFVEHDGEIKEVTKALVEGIN